MKEWVGGVLLAIGVLIAGASGLCSIMVITASMPLSMIDLKEGLPIVLLFGGLPFAIGLTMGIGGLRLMRSARRGSEPAGGPSPDQGGTA